MSRATDILHRLADCRRGAAAVEAAFVLPLLLFVLFAIVEFGRISWTKSAVDFAVQEAARCASIRPDICGSADQIRSYAAGKVQALGVPASAFTATPGQPCGVRVSAAYPYRFMTGALVAAAMGGEPVIRAEVCRA